MLKTKIPFFGNKFSPKKIPSRRTQSLSNLNLDSTQMKQEFGIDCVPAKINLGGSELAFEEGQWIPVNGFGAASHQEMMILRKDNEQLQNENNFLRLKVESLLDMLTEISITADLQNNEMSQLKSLVKTGGRKHRD